MNEEGGREGCAVGERNVDADGAAEKRYRLSDGALPERDMNTGASLLMMSNGAADAGKRPGKAMPVPAAE